jgi:hypothetical protein
VFGEAQRIVQPRKRSGEVTCGSGLVRSLPDTSMRRAHFRHGKAAVPQSSTYPQGLCEGQQLATASECAGQRRDSVGPDNPPDSDRPRCASVPKTSDCWYTHTSLDCARIRAIASDYGEGFSARPSRIGLDRPRAAHAKTRAELRRTRLHWSKMSAHRKFSINIRSELSFTFRW